MKRNVSTALVALTMVSFIVPLAWSQSTPPAPPTTSGPKSKVESEVDRLTELREKLAKDGKEAEALPIAEKVVELRRKQSPVSEALAVALTSLADIQADLNKFTESDKNFAEAIKILKQVNKGSAREAAVAWNLWGSSRLTRDLTEEAQRCYMTSEVILEQLFPDSLQVAGNLNQLGNVADEQGHLEEAQQFHSRALAIRERLAPGSLDVAYSLNNLGVLAIERGQLDEAQRQYSRAHDIVIRLKPNSHDAACSCNNLGDVAFQRGRLEEAIRFHTQALAIRERVEPDSVYFADSLNNLGNIVSAQGHQNEAAGYYDRALAVYERIKPGSLDVAMTLNNVAICARWRGKLEDARQCHTRALAIRERLAPGSLQVASSLEGLGTIASDENKLEEATQFYSRAASIYDQVAPDSLDVANCLNNLANVASDRNQLDEAERYLSRALAIKQELAPNSLDVSNALASFESLQRRRGSLPALNQYSERHLGVIQSLLVREASSQGGDTGSFGAEAANSLSRLGWQQNPAANYRWLVSLRAAGMTLQSRAQVTSRLASSDPKISNAMQNVQICTKSESDWVTTPRPKEMDSKTWDDKLFNLRQKKQSAELALSSLLKNKDPRMSDDLSVKVEDVQQAVPKDHTLVEFLRVASWDEKENQPGPDSYAAFVVNASSPVRYVKLAEASKVDNDVASFMSLVDLSNPNGEDEKERDALGKKLFQELVAPLGKLPANVLLAPDGSLHSLAFDALQNKSGRYLLETNSVSLVGGGRDLAVKAPTGPTSAPVVMGVGSFDANMDHHSQAATTLAPKLTEASSVDRGNVKAGKWSPLPSAEIEANEVAGKLGVSPVLGEDAVEERFLSIKSPKVLHLATHGFFFPPAFEKPKDDRMQTASMGQRIGYADNPMLRSGIVLAGANDEEKLRGANFLPGWVTALDISLMDLRGTELVVLSACNTGRGEVKLSEGVFGLQRAFKFAGAQSLVMSLFDVPDTSTHKLMADFYDNWKPGSPSGTKQQALHAAKLKLLKDPKTASPKNWAGFVLLGDR